MLGFSPISATAISALVVASSHVPVDIELDVGLAGAPLTDLALTAAPIEDTGVGEPDYPAGTGEMPVTGYGRATQRVGMYGVTGISVGGRAAGAESNDARGVVVPGGLGSGASPMSLDGAGVAGGGPGVEGLGAEQMDAAGGGLVFTLGLVVGIVRDAATGSGEATLEGEGAATSSNDSNVVGSIGDLGGGASSVASDATGTGAGSALGAGESTERTSSAGVGAPGAGGGILGTERTSSAGAGAAQLLGGTTMTSRTVANIIANAVAQATAATNLALDSQGSVATDLTSNGVVVLKDIGTSIGAVIADAFAAASASTRATGDGSVRVQADLSSDISMIVVVSGGGLVLGGDSTLTLQVSLQGTGAVGVGGSIRVIFEAITEFINKLLFLAGNETQLTFEGGERTLVFAAGEESILRLEGEEVRQ